MIGGYSPYQLVYDRNPNIPSVMCDSPPSLEGITISEMFAEHISALHAGRKAFIQAEASEKVRRALKHKVRSWENSVSIVDMVYYKRDNHNEWKGPGNVLGQNGKNYNNRSRWPVYQVHSSRVMKLTYDMNNQTHCTNNNGNDVQNSQTVSDTASFSLQPENDSYEPDSNDDPQPNETLVKEQNTDDLKAASTSIQLPKVGTKVTYLPQGSDTWMESTVMSRAGKATGKYKNWLNIVDEDGVMKSADWENDVKCWRNVTEDNVVHEDDGVIGVTNSEHRVREAKQSELQNWKDLMCTVKSQRKVNKVCHVDGFVLKIGTTMASVKLRPDK